MSVLAGVGWYDSYAALIRGLNPEQGDVCNNLVDNFGQAGPPLRVLATAGSGKTRTVVASVARIINEKKGQPEDIVCTTFTKKAAGELLERFRQVLPPGIVPSQEEEREAREQKRSAKSRLRYGTFHSLANKAVFANRRHLPNYNHQWAGALNIDLPFGQRQGTPPANVPKNSAQYVTAEHLWAAIVLTGKIPGLPEDYPSLTKQLKRDDLDAKLISQQVDILRGRGFTSPDEIPSDYEEEIDEATRLAWTLYNKAKDAIWAWDFADSLHAYWRLAKDGRVSAKLFIVDEAQDNNPVQMQIAMFAARNGGGRAVFVGDIRQSIYAFRGAAPGIMAGADQTLGATTLTLIRNYRSGKKIVEAGNIVCIDPKGKTETWAVGPAAIAARENEGRIEIWSEDSPMSRAFRIAADVAARKREGELAHWKDAAVLARTRAAGGYLEVAFMKEKIPAIIQGGGSFFGSKPIAMVMSHIRLALGIGPGTLQADFKKVLRTSNQRLPMVARKVIDELWDSFSESVLAGRMPVSWSKFYQAERTGRLPNGRSYDPKLMWRGARNRDRYDTDMAAIEECLNMVADGRGAPPAEVIERLARALSREMLLDVPAFRSHESEGINAALQDDEDAQDTPSFLGGDAKKAEEEGEGDNDGAMISALIDIASYFGSLQELAEFSVAGKLSALSDAEEGASSRDAVEEARKEAQDAVRVGTVHSSKGLEWELVYLLAGKKEMPHQGKFSDEEKRLFYVGVTRAAARLVLTCVGGCGPYVDSLRPLIAPTENIEEVLGDEPPPAAPEPPTSLAAVEAERQAEPAPVPAETHIAEPVQEPAVVSIDPAVAAFEALRAYVLAVRTEGLANEGIPYNVDIFVRALDKFRPRILEKIREIIAEEREARPIPVPEVIDEAEAAVVAAVAEESPNVGAAMVQVDVPDEPGPQTLPQPVAVDLSEHARATSLSIPLGQARGSVFLGKGTALVPYGAPVLAQYGPEFQLFQVTGQGTLTKIFQGRSPKDADAIRNARDGVLNTFLATCPVPEPAITLWVATCGQPFQVVAGRIELPGGGSLIQDPTPLVKAGYLRDRGDGHYTWAPELTPAPQGPAPEPTEATQIMEGLEEALEHARGEETGSVEHAIYAPTQAAIERAQRPEAPRGPWHFEGGTLYLAGEMMGNISAIEVRELDLEVIKWAQYDRALKVRVIPKGKRNPRGVTVTDRFLAYVPKGLPAPVPDGIYPDEGKTEGGVTVRHGRYSSVDSRWVSDFMPKLPPGAWVWKWHGHGGTFEQNLPAEGSVDPNSPVASNTTDEWFKVVKGWLGDVLYSMKPGVATRRWKHVTGVGENWSIQTNPMHGPFFEKGENVLFVVTSDGKSAQISVLRDGKPIARFPATWQTGVRRALESVRDGKPIPDPLGPGGKGTGAWTTPTVVFTEAPHSGPESSGEPTTPRSYGEGDEVWVELPGGVHVKGIVEDENEHGYIVQTGGSDPQRYDSLSGERLYEMTVEGNRRAQERGLQMVSMPAGPGEGAAEGLSEDAKVGLAKIRKRANPGTMKALAAALEAMGVKMTGQGKPVVQLIFPAGADETPDKPGWWVKGHVMIVAPAGHVRKSPTPEAVAALSVHGMPKDREAEETERRKPLRLWMEREASRLLGLEPIERAEDGRPERDRNRLTDFTIRTCQVCFRDIKATTGVMADHGFQISGRDITHHGGVRRGSCEGVGHLPFEKDKRLVETTLEGLLARSKMLVHRLAQLKSGQITGLTRDVWDSKLGRYESRELHPTDGYEWKRALESEISETENKIRGLWLGSFNTIPWYRAIIRTWAPWPDDKPCIGAPRPPILPEDLVGAPGKDVPKVSVGHNEEPLPARVRSALDALYKYLDKSESEMDFPTLRGLRNDVAAQATIHGVPEHQEVVGALKAAQAVLRDGEETPEEFEQSFASAFDEEFEALRGQHRVNLVPISELRKALDHHNFHRESFEKGLYALRKANRYVLESWDGRHGKPADSVRAGGIVENGRDFLYVSKREEDAPKPVKGNPYAGAGPVDSPKGPTEGERVTMPESLLDQLVAAAEEGKPLAQALKRAVSAYDGYAVYVPKNAWSEFLETLHDLDTFDLEQDLSIAEDEYDPEDPEEGTEERLAELRLAIARLKALRKEYPRWAAYPGQGGEPLPGFKMADTPANAQALYMALTAAKPSVTAIRDARNKLLRANILTDFFHPMVQGLLKETAAVLKEEPEDVDADLPVNAKDMSIGNAVVDLDQYLMAVFVDPREVQKKAHDLILAASPLWLWQHEVVSTLKDAIRVLEQGREAPRLRFEVQFVVDELKHKLDPKELAKARPDRTRIRNQRDRLDAMVTDVERSHPDVQAAFQMAAATLGEAKGGDYPGAPPVTPPTAQVSGVLKVSPRVWAHWARYELENADEYLDNPEHTAFAEAMRASNRRALREIPLTPQIVAYLQSPNGPIYQHDDLAETSIADAMDDVEREDAEKLVRELGELKARFPEAAPSRPTKGSAPQGSSLPKPPPRHPDDASDAHARLESAWYALKGEDFEEAARNIAAFDKMHPYQKLYIDYRVRFEQALGALDPNPELGPDSLRLAEALRVELDREPRNPVRVRQAKTRLEESLSPREARNSLVKTLLGAAGQATPSEAKPPGATGDFPEDFDKAFDDARRGAMKGTNLVPLYMLRRAMPGYSREEFDRKLMILRKERFYVLETSESRHGKPSQEAMDAAIVESGRKFVYVSKVEEPRETRSPEVLAHRALQKQKLVDTVVEQLQKDPKGLLKVVLADIQRGDTDNALVTLEKGVKAALAGLTVYSSASTMDERNLARHADAALGDLTSFLGDVFEQVKTLPAAAPAEPAPVQAPGSWEYQGIRQGSEVGAPSVEVQYLWVHPMGYQMRLERLMSGEWRYAIKSTNPQVVMALPSGGLGVLTRERALSIAVDAMLAFRRGEPPQPTGPTPADQAIEYMKSALEPLFKGYHLRIWSGNIIGSENIFVDYFRLRDGETAPNGIKENLPGLRIVISAADTRGSDWRRGQVPVGKLSAKMAGTHGTKAQWGGQYPEMRKFTTRAEGQAGLDQAWKKVVEWLVSNRDYLIGGAGGAAASRTSSAEPGAEFGSLGDFADQVLAAVGKVGPNGRFGHRVYIGHVARAMGLEPGADFKSALLAASNAGFVRLGTDELVRHMSPKDLSDSEVVAGKARYHFVVNR